MCIASTHTEPRSESASGLSVGPEDYYKAPIVINMHAARLLLVAGWCSLFFTIASVGRVGGFAFAVTHSIGKTAEIKGGLGAATSDVITITVDNFADTVSYARVVATDFKLLLYTSAHQ